MTNKECQTIKELFNIKFEALEKQMNNIIVSNKEVNKGQQKLLDSHCKRIRSMEAEQQKNKTKAEVNATKIAAIIGSIIFVIIFAFDRLANWIDHIFKG